jgi:hypothetical protein
VIKITLLSGFDHVVPTDPNGTPNYAAYSTSLNTQAALQAAYDAGHWEPYTPPEPEPRPIEPDWDGFNLAILTNAEFNAAYNTAMAAAPLVAAALPAALTQVATGSTSMLSVAFNALCQVALVDSTLRDDWADIAEFHNLPTDFVEVIRG